MDNYTAKEEKKIGKHKQGRNPRISALGIGQVIYLLSIVVLYVWILDRCTTT